MNTANTRRALVAAGCVVAFLAFVAPAAAVLSGHNGRILFTSGRDGTDANAKLYLRTVIGSAGGGIAGEAITSTNGQHRHPTWAPDRERIAYSHGGDIFILNIAVPGSPRQNITNSPNNDDRPAWSPDGTKIAFENGSTVDIGIYDVASGNTTNLTNTGGVTFEGKPAWTPDSQTLYYHVGNPQANFAKIVSRPAAGGAEQFIFGDGATQNAFQPSVSPDGEQICFSFSTTAAFDANAEVKVSLANGGGSQTVVPAAATGAYNCTWSPDGTKIAYAYGTFSNADLFMEQADNSGSPIPLESTAGAFDGNPDWAPDGKPECQADTVQTPFETAVQIPVTCLDTGPFYERTPVTEFVSGSIDPTENGTVGTVTQGDPSTVTYTPNAGFSGTDSFTLTGFDAVQFATPATITVEVGQPGGGGDGDDDDDVPPLLKLSGKKAQKLGKAVKLGAQCDENCSVAAGGVIVVKTPRKAGTAAKKKFELRSLTKQLTANVRKQFKLKVSKKARRAGKRALKRGGKVRAKLTATATDAAGNATVKKRRVALKLRKRR